ncbi:MAG: response regulator transcription factor [Lachnospiraceae bacterium]|nr:response regulator transcription factor [Lachnospiraceae bacterium]
MQDYIKIAVCEDEQTQRSYITELVSAWAAQKGVVCETDEYGSAEQLIYSFDGDFPYHIFILDIQMGSMNGMELARQIRDKDSNVVIIFLTGVKDYAIEGYEVGAVRYLLKPVREHEFFDVMDEAAKKGRTAAAKCFLLEHGGDIQKIPFKDIWYVESQGHYLQMAYGEQTVQWKSSLGKIQDLFEENGFVMARRGVLVNLMLIARVGRTECILDNGEHIPVSRNQYKSVNEAFIQYYKNRRE